MNVPKFDTKPPQKKHKNDVAKASACVSSTPSGGDGRDALSTGATSSSEDIPNHVNAKQHNKQKKVGKQLKEKQDKSKSPLEESTSSESLSELSSSSSEDQTFKKPLQSKKQLGVTSKNMHFGGQNSKDKLSSSSKQNKEVQKNRKKGDKRCNMSSESSPSHKQNGSNKSKTDSSKSSNALRQSDKTSSDTKANKKKTYSNQSEKTGLNATPAVNGNHSSSSGFLLKKNSLSRRTNFETQSSAAELENYETANTSTSSLSYPNQSTINYCSNSFSAAKPSNSNHIHFNSDEEDTISSTAVDGNDVTLNANLSYENDNSLLGNQGTNLIVQQSTIQGHQQPNGVNGRNDLCEGEARKEVDYSALPPLCGPPRCGDRIAYKVYIIQ